MKPYTYEEIEEFLKKELQKSKHIMTFGVFGSLDIKNDLDVLVTKKPSSKPSEFYKEFHKLLENLDNYIKKYFGGKLIRVSRANHEEEVKYIANYNPKKDLVLQATTYVSLPQIKKNWAGEVNKWDELEAISKKILKKQRYIVGSYNLIFSRRFNKEIKNEGLFGFLDIHDRINSNLPEDFLVHKMNKLYEYILKKMLGVKTLKAKNRKEAKKIFYKICKKIER